MCDEGASENNAFIQETSGKSSPPRHSTPVRQIDKKQRNNGFSSGIAAFNLLPAHHITPPSGLTKFIARNPFDADLTSRLHLSVISPTVFTKVCLRGRDYPHPFNDKQPLFLHNFRFVLWSVRTRRGLVGA